MNQKVLKATLAVVLILSASFYVFNYFQTRLRAEQIYNKAIEEQQKGNLESAKQNFSELIKINPSYKDAKDRFTEVKKQINAQSDPRIAAFYRLQEQQKNNPTQNLLSKRSKNPKTKSVLKDSKTKNKIKVNNVAVKSILENLPSEYKMKNSKIGEKVSTFNYIISGNSSNVRELSVTLMNHDDSRQASEYIYSLRYKYPRNQQIIWINGNMAYYGNNGKDLSVLAWAQAEQTIELEGKTENKPAGTALDALMKLVP